MHNQIIWKLEEKFNGFHKIDRSRVSHLERKSYSINNGDDGDLFVAISARSIVNQYNF